MAIFEALLRLRQIVCHPHLVSFLNESIGDSGKMEALLVDLETIYVQKQKVIYF